MPEADNDLVYFFPATRKANLKFGGGRPLSTTKGGDLRKVSAINEKPVNRGLYCNATDIRLASPGQNGGRGGSQENLGERRLFSGSRDPNGDPSRNVKVPRYDELQGVGSEPVLPWMMKKPQELGRTMPHGHSCQGLTGKTGNGRADAVRTMIRGQAEVQGILKDGDKKRPNFLKQQLEGGTPSRIDTNLRQGPAESTPKIPRNKDYLYLDPVGRRKKLELKNRPLEEPNPQNLDLQQNTKAEIVKKTKLQANSTPRKEIAERSAQLMEMAAEYFNDDFSKKADKCTKPILKKNREKFVEA